MELKEFLSALRSAKENFEEVLYEGIRWHALKVCTPHVNRVRDSSLPHLTVNSQATDTENNGSSYENEYEELRKSLFTVFEQYIIGENGSEDSTPTLCKLEAKLKAIAPARSAICGRIFQMHTSSGGGCCDCGDVEAWRNGAQCSLHQVPSTLASPNMAQTSSADQQQQSDEPSVNFTDDIDTTLSMELDTLREHIDSLPADVVSRTCSLLKPIIHSMNLCFWNLVQGSPISNNRPLSKVHTPQDQAELTQLALSKLMEKVFLKKPGEKPEFRIADDLWMNPEDLVIEIPDNISIQETWPPDLSHTPLVPPMRDALTLNQELWPRTAPTERSAEYVKARSLFQLSQARRLHPRLFTPHSLRTPQERTTATQSFVVILYNNEYHNYEQVWSFLDLFVDSMAAIRLKMVRL
ncbi:unnamed protein product [Echinostoma caproni]|uniref:E3 ubiquitin-protein ligase n=1 Tax=Echinostoma caproni TaxID=27848 RepID=A0A183AWD1_9TREM|nr:unnamed protein product [Echinostoma caproni]